MSGPLLEPADHAVRETALDPTRSFIVEAPAGSGKTELLTRRFLRLLASVREPEEVLAITFTRKAAAEMRSRILKALTLAELDTPEKPSQKAVWELARAVRDADRRFDWQLRSHPARLRIMTIDALNNFLARQLPILSGIGATLRIAEDPDALYAETVLRLIERLSSRGAEADAIARLLRHLDNRYEAFESLLSSELNRREYWLDLGLMRFDLPQLRKELESALRAAVVAELEQAAALVPRETRDELLAMLTHSAAMLNSLGIDSPITSCDNLSGLPRAECEALKHWRGLATLLLTEKGDWRAVKGVNKNIGFPPEDKASKQRFTDLLTRLQRETDFADALHRARELPGDRYTDEQWQVLEDLLEVLKVAIAELELVMRERGEGDYPANAIAARRALGSVDEPTDLALRLDYRLQHLLVDEFQDTSRGQIELLALLTAGWTEGDGRTLFCVGDPMQSIYRFRHADVGLFLNLKARGLNQLRLTPLRLTVNFRSSKPVMNWVNLAFESALPRRDDPHRGAVAFTPSEVQTAAGEHGGVVVHALVGDKLDMRVREAVEICELIKRTQSVTPDARVAVLVGNRLHLKWVIRELRSQSIAFTAVDIDPLVSRPAIQDLLALTRALTHLADRTAWLAILRAPWCGLSIADLQGLCGDELPGEEEETIWARLQQTQRLDTLTVDGRARIDRIVDVLATALQMRGRMALRECVERTWLSLAGPSTVESESALADCDAFFQRLEDIERDGDLEDVARIEEALKDLYAVDASSGASKVELMTIHRAKGLEYDVVILPALDSGSRTDESPLLRSQGSSRVGDRALLLAPIAPRGMEADAIYGWLARQDKERSRLEKGRLLYVAATRAIRELHLFGTVEFGKKPVANTFLKLLWPLVEGSFAGVVAGAAVDSKVAVRDASIRTRRVPLEWKSPPPNESFGALRLRNLVDDEPLTPEFAWASETARHIGTLVHREIDRWTRARIFEPEGDAADALRFQTALAELGVPSALRDAASRRIHDAMVTMSRDERGRWLLAGDVHSEAKSEFAVSGSVGGELKNGIIDRTFVDRDGVRWIVDFKTSTHEGGGLEAFLENEVLRYRPQLQLYATLMRGIKNQPIKAALYFPLLGAWREVAVD